LTGDLEEDGLRRIQREFGSGSGSGEKRSRTPSRRIGLCAPWAREGRFRCTVPSSSSWSSGPRSSSADELFRSSSRRGDTPSGGSSAKIEQRRVGRTEGADISPTHSSARTGPNARISKTSNPKTLNTLTFPACVPTAIKLSLSLPLDPSSRPSSEESLGSHAVRPFLLPSLFKMDKPVAGPSTYYVLSTRPPSRKSTSRHRPSCPILTTREAYPGRNSTAVIPPMEALCSLFTSPSLVGCSLND
jgi:hypothetical protein